MFWAIQQALNRDDKLREEGRQEGRLEGRQEGRLEGRQEGRLEGRQEGRLEGHQEGHQEGRMEGRQEGRQQRDDELIREARETGFVQIGDMKIPVPGELSDKENGNPADAAPRTLG